MEYIGGGIAFVLLGFGVAVLFGRAARLGAEPLERMDVDRL